MWRQTIFRNLLAIFIISYFISGSAWSENEWNRLAMLTASDKNLGDAFGESVSVSGDYAVLGAEFDDDNGEDSGSAYIFKRQGNVWIEQCKLTASDGNSFDLFGYCVSISGNYAIVGTYGGATAYIFKRDGETWFEQCKLDVNEPVDWRVEPTVSISERHAIVSTYARDEGEGYAYIFEREEESWNLQCKLTGPVDYYGWSVAICNNYAIIGARSHPGTAFIYGRSGNTWSLQCELIGSDSGFGRSVDICQNYAIVGSTHDNENGPHSGAAYIYKREDNTWNMEEKLIASDGTAYDGFGSSVSISGNLAIVAAYNDDDNGKCSGSAYIFRRLDSGWQEVSKIASSNPLLFERFGTSVSISGRYAFVGTSGTAVAMSGPIHGDEYKYGRAYVFTSKPVYDHLPCNYYVSDFYGNDNNDGLSQQSPFKTIQKGIDSAENGDTVVVEPGLYKGPGNRDIDFNGKAITVRSTDPNDPNIVASTIVDCNGSEADPHRGFFFHSQEESDSVLDGFTIINGYVFGCDTEWEKEGGGGGIFIYNSSPTISNCIIKHNHVEMEHYSCDFCSGGGICIYGGSPVIENCIIIENSTGDRGCGAGINYAPYFFYNPIIRNCIITKNDATGWHGQGGGIYCRYESTLTVIDCTISENCARGGGGMCNYRSSPNIVNCTFSCNSATYSGGGIYNTDESSPAITNCTFNNNSARSSGGGITNTEYSSPIITNCIFTGNSIDIGSGGGISNRYNSSTTIMGCIFRVNSAFGEWSAGGGVHNSDSDLILINSIFIANSAGYGGGVYSAWKSELSMDNCTFTENLAMNGSAIACNSHLHNDMCKLYVSNCIIWNGIDWLWNDGKSVFNINYSNIEGGWPDLGNIDCDPCFVDDGYWDPNGTPEDANDDFWIDGDYHLKSEGWRWDTDNQIWTSDDVTSPCIDAGNPGSPLGYELMSVPVDPNNEWGINNRINMGFYGGTDQASMPPYDWALLADLNNDGTVNLDDFGYFSSYWRSDGNDLPADFDRNKTVGPVDLELFIEDWLQTTSWY